MFSCGKVEQDGILFHNQTASLMFSCGKVEQDGILFHNQFAPANGER
jgi:hypothetical protein